MIRCHRIAEQDAAEHQGGDSEGDDRFRQSATGIHNFRFRFHLRQEHLRAVRQARLSGRATNVNPREPWADPRGFPGSEVLFNPIGPGLRESQLGLAGEPGAVARIQP